MLTLRRARVPLALLPPDFGAASDDPTEPAVLCDLSLEGGTVAAVRPTGATAATGPGDAVEDVDGGLVFPSFVDAHVHLDKTHTWPRAPNRSGTFDEALAVLARDRDHWTAADLMRRADFALRTAWAHGTRVVRTHVDAAHCGAEVSHTILASLRERWRDRLELQTVPLCPLEAYAGAAGEEHAALARRCGASALGGWPRMSPDLPREYERLLDLARAHGVGLDLHVDENGDPAAECLRLLAEAVLRTRFPHPVICGHCCSLAVQEPTRQRETIALVRNAGIGVVALPLCNLYLQDRRGTAFPRTPRWRGLTLVLDLLDAGVPVACASDNVRDAFFAYGDYDMLEVYAQSVRLAHLDGCLAESVKVATATAADLVGRPEYGRIAPGAPAHLVVFTARSFSELLSRPGAPRRCVDGEALRTLTPPDPAELDG